MSPLWKAVFAAAISIAAAAPAQAADFLIYTFAIEGRGWRGVNQPDGTSLIREGAASGDVVFYLPIDAVGRSSFGWTYRSPDPFPPHGGVARVGEDSFTIAVSTPTIRGYHNRTVSMSACGDFGGTFQPIAVAIDTGCSTFEIFHGRPYGYGGDGMWIRGTVTGMTVTEGFGTPYQLGYISGPEFFLPEPATWALLVMGIGMVGGSLRRRRRAPQAASAIA